MSWSARSAAASLELGAAEVVVVVGPTASGKSELALELAEARGGEIIGADSVQVYRHFDVGSGKPTAEERARVPHHLVDVADPREPMDAGAYERCAAAALDAARARGRLPIVCGGTFFWVRALLYGLAGAPAADPALRQRHLELLEASGPGALYERLAEVDPEAARRLHPHDHVRVSRALEVFEATGRPISAWQGEHGFRTPRYRAKLVGIGWSAEALAARIAERTRRALERGWIDEVSALAAGGYREARAMSSVGYRQVLEHLDGRLASGDLGPAIDRATRVFARRQRTWLRRQPVEWIEPAGHAG